MLSNTPPVQPPVDPLHESPLRDLLHSFRGRLDPHSLDNWDPDVIRAMLPFYRNVFQRYFRTSVRGLANIPDGPSVIAGIHGGGMATPDATLMLLAYYDYTNVQRRLYSMAHRMLYFIPGFNRLMAAMGGIEGTQENAARVLAEGHRFMVFPGGEDDMCRPFSKRHAVNFAGRTGFVRSALDAGAPIVPAGAVGGHEGYYVLTDGRAIAEKLGLKRWLHVKYMPLALCLPWGLTVGYMPYIPAPVRVAVAFGEPMHFHPSAKERTDPHYHAYVRDQVEAEVQRLVHSLRSE